MKLMTVYKLVVHNRIEHTHTLPLIQCSRATDGFAIFAYNAIKWYAFYTHHSLFSYSYHTFLCIRHYSIPRRSVVQSMSDDRSADLDSMITSCTDFLNQFVLWKPKVDTETDSNSVVRLLVHDMPAGNHCHSGYYPPPPDDGYSPPVPCRRYSVNRQVQIWLPLGHREGRERGEDRKRRRRVEKERKDAVGNHGRRQELQQPTGKSGGLLWRPYAPWGA